MRRVELFHIFTDFLQVKSSRKGPESQICSWIQPVTVSHITQPLYIQERREWKKQMMSLYDKDSFDLEYPWKGLKDFPRPHCEYCCPSLIAFYTRGSWVSQRLSEKSKMTGPVSDGTQVLDCLPYFSGLGSQSEAWEMHPNDLSCLL